jgi:hypothetical protein
VHYSERRYRDLGELSGPYERSRIAVVGVDVACDLGLQIVDGMEGSASNLAACDGREEALDSVEPLGRGRVKWNIQRG